MKPSFASVIAQTRVASPVTPPVRGFPTRNLTQPEVTLPAPTHGPHRPDGGRLGCRREQSVDPATALGTDFLRDVSDETLGAIRLGQIVIHAKALKRCLMIIENRRATDHHSLERVVSFDASANLDPRENRKVQ